MRFSRFFVILQVLKLKIMKKRYLWLTISLMLLLFCSITAKAQSAEKQRVDSLRRELPKLKGDDLLQAYYKIYNLCYYAGDTKAERKAIDDLLKEADRQGNVKKQATARTALLYYYYNTDQDDSLLAQYPAQLEFMRKNGDWKLYYDIWVLIVNHYTFTSKSNTALREVKRMYDDAQQRDNSYGLGLASYGMGNAYMNIGFQEEAIQSYERCIKILNQAKMGSSTLLDVYPYYCSVLSEMKNYERMLEVTDLWRNYLDQHKAELGLDSKTASSSYYAYYYNSRATALMGLGRGLGRLKEAEDLLKLAYEATKDVKDNSQLTVFYNLGQLYMKKGEYGKALEFNNRIIGNAGHDDPSGLLMLKKQRAEIMLQSDRFDEAAVLYKQVYYLADSLNLHDAKNQLNEFNTLFKVDEMEQEAARAHTRHIYIVLIIIIIALLLIMLLVLYFMRRMHQKNRELAVALDKAQESDRMKRSFVQHVSHEIRTPLNVITGFSQVIASPTFRLTDEQRANIVESIETNTREITNFVNELLEFSENESQNIDSQLTVTSNQRALERILKQLFNNAMKFTEKGSVILKVVQTLDKSSLEISVTDTGIGIAADQREHIFEKFYKVDSFKRGLGLGLPMARRIARMIRGDLLLDDNYTEGTRFILKIPNK